MAATRHRLEDPVDGVEWSPDGEWLAYSLAPGGGMNRQVELVRPDGRGSRRITDGGAEVNWLGGWDDRGARLRIASNRKRPEARRTTGWSFRAGSIRPVAPRKPRPVS